VAFILPSILDDRGRRECHHHWGRLHHRARILDHLRRRGGDERARRRRGDHAPPPAPPHAAGTVDVVVTVGGTSVTVNGFAFVYAGLEAPCGEALKR